MREYDKVIFVAQTGNCREAMAAAILKSMTLKKPVEVLARGLVVQFPEPLNQKAEAVMIANQTPLRGFVSVQLSEEEITPDTLILTMESVHKKRVKDRFPQLDDDHLEVLTAFVGAELEILDPYGGQVANYGLCYECIRNCVKRLVQVLNGELI